MEHQEEKTHLKANPNLTNLVDLVNLANQLRVSDLI